MGDAGEVGLECIWLARGGDVELDAQGINRGQRIGQAEGWCTAAASLRYCGKRTQQSVRD